jgi:hypothetical protein
MESVKGFKSKCSLGTIKRRREPARADNLSALKNHPVLPTVTEIDGNVMDARCVKNAEFFRTSRWKSARSAAMAKLDTKAKILKSSRGEKLTIPEL